MVECQINIFKVQPSYQPWGPWAEKGFGTLHFSLKEHTRQLFWVCGQWHRRTTEGPWTYWYSGPFTLHSGTLMLAWTNRYYRHYHPIPDLFWNVLCGKLAV